ncbi:MAG: hypothetical protein AAGA11_22755 [Pseudomonadota bacterium]
MTSPDNTVPIGFSDLTDDEGLVVMLYRDWQRLGPPRAVAEHAIARALKADALYPWLGPLFDACAAVGVDASSTGEGTDLLSGVEEQLLDLVSQTLPRSPRPDPAPALRPIRSIPRSGHDALLHAVHRASWRVARRCAVAVER